jgi:hypothetical protein
MVFGRSGNRPMFTLLLQKVVLLWCYRRVTVVLQWCYSGAAVVLQWCYCGVTVVLLWCYCGVTRLVVIRSTAFNIS